MPNCFILCKKSDPKTRIKFVEIDKELCDHFGQPCNDKYWLWNWYDMIGMLIACGHNLGTESFKTHTSRLNDNLQEVAKYLENNYVSDAWYESKRG